MSLALRLDVTRNATHSRRKTISPGGPFDGTPLRIRRGIRFKARYTDLVRALAMFNLATGEEGSR